MSEMMRTEHIVKHFGTTRAVDDISLRVNKGEIYGFLGLNGAGKTTLIRMLLGMIRPTAGKAYLDNVEIRQGEARIWRQVGYLVETPYSYPDLTVKENLDVIRKLRLLPNHDSVINVMEKLELTNYSHVKAGHLSLGNAQRLGIAKALIHEPQILILDEPANGLDPAGILEIRQLLSDLARNEGVTIFISSHILGEISKLITRVGIIHEGHLIKELKAAELQQQLVKQLFVSSRNTQHLQACLMEGGYTFAKSHNGSFAVTDADAIAHPDQVATYLVRQDAAPTRLQVEEEDLETFFLRSIKGVMA